MSLGNTAQFPPCGLSTAPAAAARHLRCQNVGLRYPHRASGAKVPRTLRPLPLLRFAASATGGAHLCSIQYYLRFWLSICRTSLAVSALRIMRYCPKATPHNSRLTAQAPLRRLRHGICVAKMLDNVGLRYPASCFGGKSPSHSATAAPASVRCFRHWRRSPLQHPVLSALLAWHLPHLARRIGT